MGVIEMPIESSAMRRPRSCAVPSTKSDVGRRWRIRVTTSTRLTKDEFGCLVEETRKHGLVTICTPFDEPSVDMIVDLGIEVVKIGSCSATDWPLIEKVADCDKPVIFSTGGLTMKEIDDLVSFFDHRRVSHAIMHCIAIYPTPDDRLQLNQISALCRRYPDKVIGFSTHEDPGDFSPVQIAVAKGARIFERHVGAEVEGVTLNAYSANPAQIEGWIDAYLKAKRLCGDEVRPPASPEEVDSLRRRMNERLPARELIGASPPMERLRELVLEALARRLAHQRTGGVVLQPGGDRHLQRLLQVRPPVQVAAHSPGRADVGQGVGQRLLVAQPPGQLDRPRSPCQRRLGPVGQHVELRLVAVGHRELVAGFITLEHGDGAAGGRLRLRPAREDPAHDDEQQLARSGIRPNHGTDGRTLRRPNGRLPGGGSDHPRRGRHAHHESDDDRLSPFHRCLLQELSS